MPRMSEKTKTRLLLNLKNLTLSTRELADLAGVSYPMVYYVAKKNGIDMAARATARASIIKNHHLGRQMHKDHERILADILSGKFTDDQLAKKYGVSRTTIQNKKRFLRKEQA